MQNTQSFIIRANRDFVPDIGRKGIISSMSGTQRTSIRPGLHVSIVLKADQRSGKLTEGIVKDILTNLAVHPHGIKVRLENGQIGRVKEIKA